MLVEVQKDEIKKEKGKIVYGCKRGEIDFCKKKKYPPRENRLSYLRIRRVIKRNERRLVQKGNK